MKTNANPALRPPRLPALAALACLLLCTAAHAGEPDPIATDRPDFVESSNVVGKGAFQVETSVAFERSSAGGQRERAWATPTLLRFGVGDSFELRAETDGRIALRSAPAGGSPHTERGYGDVALGVKWHALDAAGALPSVGVLAHLDLPSGSAPFRGDGVRPSLRMVAEWELPNEMSLGLMPGVMRQRGEDGKLHTAGIFGIVLGKAWTSKMRTFVELAAPQFGASALGGNVASLDVGMAYLLTPRLQLDTALTRGLTRAGSDVGMTVGVSAKF